MTPKKILYFALGPIGGALLGFISLPIITWVFSQEDVGKLALLQVALSFSTLFFTLGLDQAYVRDFHESKNKSQLLKTAIVPGLSLLSITLVVFLSIKGTLLSEIVFNINSNLISWLLSIAIFCNFISRFLSLVLRMSERGLAYSISQLLPRAFVLLVVIYYMIADTDKVFSQLLFANTLSIFLVSIIFSWNTRLEWLPCFKNRIKLQKLKEMLFFGLPLIFGGIAFWGLTSLDRILLSRWSSFEELAVYSVSVSFAAVATIFQSVFSTVWAPTVYKWASKNDGHQKVIIVSRYVLLCVMILFCLAGLFSYFVTLLLPSVYGNVQWILVACLAYPLLYTLSETTVVGIGIARKSVYAMVAGILALSINLVLNFFLIPPYGAAGAASSTALSFWVFLVLRTEFSIRVWKPLPRATLYSFTFASVFGSVLGALQNNQLGYYIYLYWGFLLILSCCIFKAELNVAKKQVATFLTQRF